MKSAVCLYGSAGYSSKVEGDSTKKIPLRLYEPLNSLLKNIISINNSDVFIHSWSKERQDEITDILSPSSFNFENYRTFHKKESHINAVKSRFYSQKSSLDLMKEFSIKNNTHYDFVLSCRIDLIWFENFDFSSLDNQSFYVSNWNKSSPRPDLKADKSNDSNNLGPFDKSNYGLGVGFMEHWFLSNYKNMLKFGQISKNIQKVNTINRLNNFKARKSFKKYNDFNPHHLTYIQAQRHGFDVKYIKYRGFDYDLYRRYINPNYFKKIN